MSTSTVPSAPKVKTEHQIIRLTSSELPSYIHLHQLVALINNAFVTSWASIPGLAGADRTRYESVPDFLQDMGGEVVTFVTVADDSSPIATGGYKPWTQAWKWSLAVLAAREGHIDQQTEEQDPEEQSYEIVAVAVDPTYQKKGLVAPILRRIVEEIAENTRNDGGKYMKLMVRTGKENNERYWLAKGFVTIKETRFEKGDFGSEIGFSILDMEKIYPV